MRKGEFSSIIVNRETFKKFKDEFPEHKDITWKDFSELWGDIAETIRDQVITNPLGVKLSYYNGELKLQFVPNKIETGLNAKASYEIGERVNELNLNSRGKTCKVKWERRYAVKFNRMLQFFAFEPYRKLTKMASVYTDANVEKLRTARNTLGGKHAWTGVKRKQ